MEIIIRKLKCKEFVQDIVIKTVSDILILSIGLVLGYYLKVLLY